MQIFGGLRRAVVFAVADAAGRAGHAVGDFLVQRDCDARAKQRRTREGRRALATHAATYTLTEAAARAVAYRVTGVRVPVKAQVLVALVEGGAHAVIDDGRLLARFARASKKWGFHQLGGQRKVTGVVDGPGGVEKVHVVPVDDNGDPIIKRDEHGQISNAVRHDNPGPATGRMFLDQATHEGLQIPVGSLLTAVLADRWGDR
ncbi:hypothetical protein PIS_062 [Saccharomonospora phage PIS 136]|nr:hypothetical protein PIS_062 [Saccharomonospora phage PIS 136]